MRRQVEALETTLGFTTPATTGAPVAGTTVLLLADAVRRRRRVRAGYRSFEGAETRRDISPFGLVIHAGRWYLYRSNAQVAGYDPDAQVYRTYDARTNSWGEPQSPPWTAPTACRWNRPAMPTWSIR